MKSIERANSVHGHNGRPVIDVCGTPDQVRHALATSPGGKGELEWSRGCPVLTADVNLVLLLLTFQETETVLAP